MRARAYARAVLRLGPYLVSHHPSCRFFAADQMKILGRQCCIACFVGYPSILVGMVLSTLLGARIPLWAWFAMGLSLASLQAFSFAGRIASRGAQVVVKVSLGLGLGFLIHAIWNLPFGVWARVGVLVLVMSAAQAFWVLRLHRIERTCSVCPQRPSRPDCDGLRDLQRRVGPILFPADG